MSIKREDGVPWGRKGMSIKREDGVPWERKGMSIKTKMGFPGGGQCQMASQRCSQKPENVLGWKDWVRMGPDMTSLVDTQGTQRPGIM